MNFLNGYNMPIMAILCDGSYFYFFKFEDGRQAGNAPQFFLGKLPNGSWRQRIAETIRRSRRSQRFLTPNSPSL